MFRLGSNEKAKNETEFTGVPGASAENLVANDEALNDFAALSNAANNITVHEDETATEPRDKDEERLRGAENVLRDIQANGLNPENIQRAKAHLQTAMKEHENGGIKSGMEADDFTKPVTDWEDRPVTPNGGPEYLSHFHGSPKMAEKYRLMGDKLDLKRDLRSPVYNEQDFECPDTPPTPGGQMMEDQWNERKLVTDPLEKDYWGSMSPTYHFTKKAYKTAAILLIQSHSNISLIPGSKAVGLSIEDLDSMTREEIKSHLDAHTPGCDHPFCLSDHNAAIIGLGALEYNHNGKILKTKAADPFSEEAEKEEVVVRKTGMHQYNNLGHSKSCGHEDCIRKRKAFTPEWEPLSAAELKEQAETMARWDDKAPGFKDADRKAKKVVREMRGDVEVRKKRTAQLKEDQKKRAAKREAEEKMADAEKAKVEREKEVKRQKLLAEQARIKAEMEAKMKKLEEEIAALD